MLDQKRQKILTIVLWVVFYAAALVLCMQIRYSDGDDAFFQEMTGSRGLFSYIWWRYVTWEGRITSEAMAWFGFRMGLFAWRFVNAFVIAMLPTGLFRIVENIFPEKITGWRRPGFFAVCCIGILCMDVYVIGYGAFWVTGSVFYLWSLTAAIWALVPVAGLAFHEETDIRQYAYSLPLTFVAAVGMEQGAAVILVFGVLVLLLTAVRSRYLPKLLLLQTLIAAAGLVVIFVSPGTDERTAHEIAMFFPQFEALGMGRHLFLTAQWLAQALARESKAYLVAIWLLLLCLLYGREKEGRYRLTMRFSNVSFRRAEEKKGNAVFGIVTLVFVAAAVLDYAGIPFFSELGIGITDGTQCVTEPASWQATTWQNHFALIWWCAAVALTLVLLWRATEDMLLKMTQELVFLGGLACSAVMYFSPTIYASGERLFFMMEILFWLLLLILFAQLYGKTTFLAGTVFFLAVACLQIGTQFEEISGMLYGR